MLESVLFQYDRTFKICELFFPVDKRQKSSPRPFSPSENDRNEDDQSITYIEIKKGKILTPYYTCDF